VCVTTPVDVVVDVENVVVIELLAVVAVAELP
jgi:hypothetical protein